MYAEKSFEICVQQLVIEYLPTCMTLDLNIVVVFSLSSQLLSRAPSGVISEYVNSCIPTHTSEEYWSDHMQTPGWQPILCVAWCLIWLFASLKEKYGHTWYRMSSLRPGVIKQHKPNQTYCLVHMKEMLVSSLCHPMSFMCWVCKCHWFALQAQASSFKKSQALTVNICHIHTSAVC